MFISLKALFTPLFLCLLVCVALNVLLRFPAVRFGLVDVPGGRKQHTGHIPLIGGVSIVLAFAFGILLLDMPYSRYAPLFAGMLLLLACGMIDDMRDMRSTTKLLIQTLTALLMMIWGGLVVDDLGAIPGLSEGLGIWGYVFTLVTVVGLINAINMMDGVDGLAGGVVLGSMFWLGVLAALSGQLITTLLVLTLAVSILGFMFFNIRHPWRRRASVFLGDAGSLVLGFALAWFAVEISQGREGAISPFAVAWLLALPVVDTISLMFRRLCGGCSPFKADREHLHHLLQRVGFMPGSVSFMLVGANFFIGGIGVAGAWLGLPDLMLCLGLLVLVVGHTWFVTHGWKRLKVLHLLHERRRQHAVPGGGARSRTLISGRFR
ncbi:MAG: MraY family glycosyltransferase [Aquisalimonadaceae bacterium]